MKRYLLILGALFIAGLCHATSFTTAASSITISGNYLLKTGDTMTGNLVAPNVSATYGITGATATLTGALTGTSASFTSLAVSSNTNAGLPLVIGAGSTPTLSVNSGLTTFGGGASANIIRFQNTTTGTGSGNGLQIYQDDVASIVFYENNLFQLGTNSDAIISMKTGNVGISTAAPTYNLDVWNTSGGLTGRFSSRSTTSNFVDFCADSGSGQGTTLGFYDNTLGQRSGYIKYAYDTDLMSFRIAAVETFFLASGGNVGISSSTPRHLLTMEAGGVGGYYSSADHQWTNGASFAAYKENIKDISLANPITSLKNIKLREYNYKQEDELDDEGKLKEKKPTKKVYGYVADELPPNFASYVISDNGGLTMNGLFVALVSITQAQQAKIESLEARVEALEKK